VILRAINSRSGWGEYWRRFFPATSGGGGLSYIIHGDAVNTGCPAGGHEQGISDLYIDRRFDGGGGVGRLFVANIR
jgi:hypothetical protein